jgi:hypothetical protein
VLVLRRRAPLAVAKPALRAIVHISSVDSCIG